MQWALHTAHTWVQYMLHVTLHVTHTQSIGLGIGMGMGMGMDSGSCVDRRVSVTKHIGKQCFMHAHFTGAR